MTDTVKRGSKGGNARAEKLTKEERSSIAREAAKKRWGKKPEVPIDEITVPATGEGTGANVSIIEAAPEPKHCPACLAGESLEEGEGTHILATVEHPVTIPTAFEDAEDSVVVPAAPSTPQKPAKRTTKPMPKEFRSASSYAEKRLPIAIREKSEAVATVAKLDNEINDLIRVIKALGGNVDHQPSPVMQSLPYQAPTGYPPTNAAPYQPPPVVPQIELPKAMTRGGVGALDLGFLANE